MQDRSFVDLEMWEEILKWKMGPGYVQGCSLYISGALVCIHGRKLHRHREPPWSVAGLATSCHTSTHLFSGLAEPCEEGGGIEASGTVLSRWCRQYHLQAW